MQYIKITSKRSHYHANYRVRYGNICTNPGGLKGKDTVKKGKMATIKTINVSYYVGQY